MNQHSPLIHFLVVCLFYLLLIIRTSQAYNNNDRDIISEEFRHRGQQETKQQKRRSLRNIKGIQDLFHNVRIPLPDIMMTNNKNNTSSSSGKKEENMEKGTTGDHGTTIALFSATNIICYDIQMDDNLDISIESSSLGGEGISSSSSSNGKRRRRSSATSAHFQLDIMSLDLKCDMDYTIYVPRLQQQPHQTEKARNEEKQTQMRNHILDSGHLTLMITKPKTTTETPTTIATVSNVNNNNEQEIRNTSEKSVSESSSSASSSSLVFSLSPATATKGTSSFALSRCAMNVNVAILSLQQHDHYNSSADEKHNTTLLSERPNDEEHRNPNYFDIIEDTIQSIDWCKQIRNSPIRALTSTSINVNDLLLFTGFSSNINNFSLLKHFFSLLFVSGSNDEEYYNREQLVIDPTMLGIDPLQPTFHLEFMGDDGFMIPATSANVTINRIQFGGSNTNYRTIIKDIIDYVMDTVTTTYDDDSNDFLWPYDNVNNYILLEMDALIDTEIAGKSFHDTIQIQLRLNQIISALKNTLVDVLDTNQLRDVELQSVRRTQYWLPCATNNNRRRRTTTTTQGGGRLLQEHHPYVYVRDNSISNMDDAHNNNNRRELEPLSSWSPFSSSSSSSTNTANNTDIMDETIGAIITTYGDELIQNLPDIMFSSKTQRQFFDSLADLVDTSSTNEPDATTTVNGAGGNDDNNDDADSTTSGAFFDDLTNLVPVDEDEEEDGDNAELDTNDNNDNMVGDFVDDLAEIVPAGDDEDDAGFFGDLTDLVPAADDNEDNENASDGVFFGDLIDLVPAGDDDNEDGENDGDGAFFGDLTDLIPAAGDDNNDGENDIDGAFFGDLTELVPAGDDDEVDGENDEGTLFGALLDLVPTGDDDDKDDGGFFSDLTDLVPDADGDGDDSDNEGAGGGLFSDLADLVPAEDDGNGVDDDSSSSSLFGDLADLVPPDNADDGSFFGDLTDLVPADDDEDGSADGSFLGDLTDLVPDGDGSFFGDLTDLVPPDNENGGDNDGGSLFGDLSDLVPAGGDEDSDSGGFFGDLSELVPSGDTEDNGGFFGDLSELVPTDTADGNNGGFFGDLSELVPVQDEIEDNDSFFGSLSDLVPDQPDSDNDSFFGNLVDLVPEQPNDTCFFCELLDLVPMDPTFIIDSCITFNVEDELLDFRDFLLSPEESLELGGSGTDPYGDLARTGFDFFRNSLSELDEDNPELLGINSLAVQPLTEAISGTPGEVSLEGAFFNQSVDVLQDFGIDLINVSLSNARARNLDTLVPPLQFAMPMDGSGQAISNEFNLGPVEGRPLNGAVTIAVGVDAGQNSILSQSNEIEFAFATNWISTIVDVDAFVSAWYLFTIPLRNVFELSCWLATIPIRFLDEDEDGFRLEGSPDQGLMVRKMELAMDTVDLNVTCLNCTSRGFAAMPELVDLIEVHTAAILTKRLQILFHDIAISEVTMAFIDSVLAEAPQFCPHRTEFNGTIGLPLLNIPEEFPEVSAESIDTMVFLGVIFSEIGVVFGAETIAEIIEEETPAESTPIENLTIGDVPEGANIIDWSNPSGIPGIILDVMQSLVLGDTVDADGKSTPRINDLISNFFLDDDGLFTIAGPDFELFGIDIDVASIGALGIDSFVRFDGVDVVAPQIFNNVFELEYITMLIDFSIDQPRTEDIPPQNFTVSFTLFEINGTVPIVAVIDADTIDSFTLGEFLRVDNILPCLLSAAYEIQIPFMDFTVGDFSEPTIIGLMDETDIAAKNSLSDVYALNWTETVKESIPYATASFIQPFLAEQIEAQLNSSGCPALPGPVVTEFARFNNGFLDFREFFLPPDRSITLGGSGTEPYGDIGLSIFYSIQELASDRNSTLALNKVFIKPITKAQSGVEGMLRFPSDIFAFSEDDILYGLLRRIDLRLFDARAWNLDTAVPPLSILHPTNQPHVIKNIIGFGPVAGRPLSLAANLLVSLDAGEASPLTMTNEIEIGLSADLIEVANDLLLKVAMMDVIKFPLRDLLNLHCWLALMPVPELNEDGTQLEGAPDRGFAIKSFLTVVSNVTARLACVNCTNISLNYALQGLNSVLNGKNDNFDDTITPTLINRLQLLVEEAILSDSIQSWLDRILHEAPQFCPHRPEYNATASALPEKITFPSELPAMSNKSVDALVFAGLYVALSGLFILIESFTDNIINDATAPSLPLLAPLIAEGDHILDFTNTRDNFQREIGGILQQARKFLGGKGSDGLPTINNVLRSFLLNGNGVLNIDLEDMTYESAGLNMTLESVQVQGIDSFTHFDVFNAIGPQSIQNSMRLERLSVTLNTSIDVISSSDPSLNISITFEVRDVNITVPLYAAFDVHLLGSLELGSLLHTNDILRCLLYPAYNIYIPQFSTKNIAVGEIVDPVIRGMLPDTTSAVSYLMQAVFEQSRDTSLLPAIVNTVVRPFANELLASYVGRSDNCPEPGRVGKSIFVNFHELFLSSPDEKTNLADAISGHDHVYGDLPSRVKQFMDSAWFDVDPLTGVPKINKALIAPLTKSQSGESGTLLFPGELFGIVTSVFHRLGIENAEIQVSDGRIDELDSFGPRLEIMEPNVTSEFLLDNRAAVGVGDDPFRAKIKVLFDVSGDPTLEMRNEMDLALELTNASIFAVLLAKLSAQELLSFPLRYLLDGSCWLALFTALPGGGVGSASRLALSHLEFAASKFHFDLSCNNCTTHGFIELPNLIRHLETSGILDELKKRLIRLGLEIITSDNSSVLADSVHRCPRYTNNQPLSNHVNGTSSNARLPSIIRSLSLSPASVETLALVCAFAVQVFVVVVSETYSYGGYHNQRDPLAAQKALDIPDDINVVDFTSLGNKTTNAGRLFKMGTDFLNYLTTPVTINEDSAREYVDYGINTLVQQLLGGRVLSFGQTSLGIDELGVSVSQIRIFGLDTFTKSRIFNIIGPQTYRSELSLKRLHLEFDLKIESTSHIMEQQEHSDSTFRLSLALEDIDVAMSVLMAVDMDKFRELPLGSLREIQNILPCFVSVLHALELSELVVSVGAMDVLDIHGFQSPDIGNTFQKLRRVVSEEYGEKLRSSLPAVFNVMVRALVNNWLLFYRNNSVTACPPPRESPVGRFVDLRDLLLPKYKAKDYGASGLEPYGNLIHTMFSRLQGLFEVDAATGLSGVNDLFFAPSHPVSLKLENYTGTFNFSGDGEFGTFNLTGDILTVDESVIVGGLDAQLAVKVTEASFENVDTIGAPLSILELTRNKPYHLNNTATIGVGKRPFHPSVRIMFDLQVGEEMRTHNDFELGVDLYAVTLVVDAFLKIAEKRLMEFPLGDVANYNCWLATVPAPILSDQGIRANGVDPTASLVKLFLSIAKLNVDLTCHSCSSPGLEELNELLSRSSLSDALTDSVNTAIRYASGLLQGDFLQDRVDFMLNLAARRCPHSPEYEGEHTELSFESFHHNIKDDMQLETVLLSISIVTFIAIVAAVLSAVRLIVRRRHKKWVKTLPRGQIRNLYKQQEKQQDLNKALDLTQSMFRSCEIPVYVRYLIPVIILGNIGFFLSGHLNLGAAVNLYAEIFGETFLVEEFFAFSIGKSTIEMWMAGARSSSIMVLLFSVVWPYAKQLTTLALWFSPPRYVTTSLRGSILLWLDTLAKWSMVDVMVMIISLAGFRTAIGSPQVSFLPENMYSFDLVVVPKWGLYANLIAQLMSQFISHFIIFYHRKIVIKSTEEYEQKYRSICENRSIATQLDKSTSGGRAKETIDPHASERVALHKAKQQENELMSSSPSKIVSERHNCKKNQSSLYEVIRNFASHKTEETHNYDQKQNLPEVCSITVSEGNSATAPQKFRSLTLHNRDTLSRHRYIRSHRGELDSRLVVRQCINYAAILVPVASCVCIIVACALPAFSIDTFGLVGLVVELGENFGDTTKTFSVFGVTYSLLDEAQFLSDPSDFVGLGSIAVLFLITVLLVPLLQLAVLFYQWFFPITGIRRKRLLLFIEVLQAWEYSEVYLFAVIVESWQLGSISQLMLNPFCGDLNGELAMLAYYGILDKKDAQCFQIEGLIENGSYLMLVGVILLALMNTFVTKASFQYFRDKDSSIEGINIWEEAADSNRNKLTEDVNSLSNAPVLFSDVFRWALRAEYVESDKESKNDEEIAAGREPELCSSSSSTTCPSSTTTQKGRVEASRHTDEALDEMSSASSDSIHPTQRSHCINAIAGGSRECSEVSDDNSDTSDLTP